MSGSYEESCRRSELNREINDLRRQLHTADHLKDRYRLDCEGLREDNRRLRDELQMALNLMPGTPIYSSGMRSEQIFAVSESQMRNCQMNDQSEFSYELTVRNMSPGCGYKSILVKLGCEEKVCNDNGDVRAFLCDLMIKYDKELWFK